MVIQDARTEPLQPWEDMGVDGLYIKMADYQVTDGWILEIPAKSRTKPQRHMFEAGMYFFGGPGHIVIQQEDKRSQDRKSQIGTGDRSAKIRTYNYPQQRVTDHRIGLTLHRLNEVLNGDLDDIISALARADMMEKIKE